MRSCAHTHSHTECPPPTGLRTAILRKCHCPGCSLSPSAAKGIPCRVAPAGCPAGALSDPDKEISTIRLFRGDGSRGRCATLGSCGDRESQVKAWRLLPSPGSAPHGPPLLRRLRGAAPLPGFVARMRPSDSPAASAVLWFPSRRPTSGYGRFSEPAGRAPVNARRVGEG